MAKKKEDTDVTKVGEDVQEVVQTEFQVPKDAIIDEPVTVISLAGDPYHKNGEEFQMAKRTAELLALRGWVEIKK